jgi:hypothetical protein
MQVRQLQVAHDSVQDRLVLRIGTQANEEIRVFITRRFLRELWPHLAATLAGNAASTTASPAPAKNAPGATFAEPFRDDNPTYPLGSNPLLAAEATLESAGDGLWRLILREMRERGVTLNLNGELLQALCSMLRATAGQAAWDINLDYAVAVPTPAPATPAPQGNKLLH